MANKERPIQDWCRQELAKIYGDKLVYVKYPASQYSQRGVADLIFCIHGLYIAIEVKTDVGMPTALQLKFGENISKAGGFFGILYGRDVHMIERIVRYVDEHKLTDR
jgi:hypothetical protein